MAATSLEERMATLEAEVARLKQQVSGQKTPSDIPWWKRRFGAFKNDTIYEEAMRLGAEYRQSQPPPPEE